MVDKGRKIAIITGITSFLGRSTAKYLLKKGFVVFGIVRPESSNIEILESIKGLHIIKLDFESLELNDFNNLNTDTIEKVKSLNADISVIHFAWAATLDRNNFAKQMLNIDMSSKVLEFAKRIKASRFIFAGSQAEKSESPYGIAKKHFGEFGEKDVTNTDMEFIHLRIFSIYGKEDRENSLIKTLVKACMNNNAMSLSSCDYKWNFLYIDDFTDILYKLIEKNAKTGIYDMASDDTRLLKDYVCEAKKVLKSKSELKFGERPDSLEKFAIPNIDDTMRAIGGHIFVKFADGIRKMRK